ncbi:hypothetical protein ACFIJ5_14985 [Haloimpatiens sp. FM7330]|uniref:hypothetical protein n=1 Tax=Haloimpatiens sp. FM7330 TaxID=3298610 RepID=UPI00362C4225
MCVLKYIGPFLRMNTLNTDNIMNQLFHLSKESFKNIVLNSKCGILASSKDLKLKNISNNDINIIENFSPLLCIYKKGDSKLINDNETLTWSSEKLKKEINISNNAFMSLCLLELCEYYEQFKNIDNKKYLYYVLYLNLCKNQLIFYASYLRNTEGVFVNKIDITDTLSEDFKFENKNSKFRYSDQALLMAAFYKYSMLSNDKYSKEFRNFSLDILNMLLQFKNELYELSFEELNKLCFALNLFYDYSDNEDGKLLLLDLCELLTDEYESKNTQISDERSLKEKCLTCLNLILSFKHIDLLNINDALDKTFSNLTKMYDDNIGIFCPSYDDKKVDFSSIEIMLYFLDILSYSTIKQTNEYNDIIYNVFKYQIVNSGIILSWPEAPNLDDVERYKDFSLKSEDLLDEINFIMPNISTPENTELAPVFIKNITFNRKKECFKQGRSSFYSEPNMFIFFTILYLKNSLKNKNI